MLLADPGDGGIMNAARHIGRVGLLAVALGVGMGLSPTLAVATADGPSDSSAASRDTTRTAHRGGPAPRRGPDRAGARGRAAVVEEDFAPALTDRSGAAARDSDTTAGVGYTAAGIHRADVAATEAGVSLTQSSAATPNPLAFGGRSAAGHNPVIPDPLPYMTAPSPVALNAGAVDPAAESLPLSAAGEATTGMATLQDQPKPAVPTLTRGARTAAESGALTPVPNWLSGRGPIGHLAPVLSWAVAAAARRETEPPVVPPAATTTGSTGLVVDPAAVSAAQSYTARTEAEQEQAGAAFNISAGWIPGVGTVYNGLRLVSDFRQFLDATRQGDVADTWDEIGDMAIDVIGMIPVVGAPLAATIHWARVSAAPVNRAPSPVDDLFTIAANTSLVGNVLTNDTDADGDALSAMIGSGPTHGAVTLDPDGSFTYTPTAGYNGTDNFSYTVNDGRGGTSQAGVLITITPVDGAPLVRNNIGYFTTKPNTTLNVFANDGLIAWDASDPQGDPLTASLASPATNGTIDLNPDGSFTYTPNFGYTGEDVFTYTVSDGTNTSNTATVGIAVAASGGIGDNPPIAYDAYRNMREGGTLTVSSDRGLVEYDSYDKDGDALTATLVDPTTNGHVSVNADGSYSYSPDAGYTGQDSFTYTVSDGTYTSNAARVSITVRNASEQNAPEAYGDSRTVDENSTLTVSARDGLLSRTAAYDNEGDALTAALASGATHGQVTLNADGSYTYAPNSGYTGADSFTYTVSDGQLTSNTATAVITVQSNVYGTQTGLALGPDGKVYVLRGTSTFDPTNGTTDSNFAIASRNVDGSLTDLVRISSKPGSLPAGLAVGADGRFYVTDHLAGSVTGYDPNNNYSATTLASISKAAGIAVDNATGRIYVTTVDYTDANLPSGQLVVLDAEGNQIGRAIDLSGPSTAVAVGPGGKVYVAGLSGGLSVYDRRVLQTAISADDLPGYFYGVTVGNDGTAYIASHEGIDESGDLLGGKVIIVDPADPTNIRQLIGVSQPWGIALVNSRVYVTDSSTQSIVVLDPANATEFTGNTGSGEVNPYSTDVETAIAMGADGTIYALHGTTTYNPKDGRITGAFHLATQNPDGFFTDVAVLGSQPTGVAVGSDGRIYVADYLAGSVTAYAPGNQYSATTVASIPDVAGIAISGTSGRIYLTTVDYTDADQPSGQLVILSSTGTQIGQPVDLAGPSAGVAVGPDGDVYVTGLLGGLAIYDDSGVLQTSISAGGLPGTFYGVAVGADGTAYISNRGSSSDSITVVNPADPTNVRQFTGVTAPWGVVVSNGIVYASSSDTQTLVAFDAATGSPVTAIPSAASLAFPAAATVATSASASAQASSAGVAAAGTASANSGGYNYSTPIYLGGTPTNVTLSANGTRGFVVVGSQVKIIEVGASTPVITDSVTVGSSPYMVAVNSFGTRAYTTNSGDGTVSIIEKGTSGNSTPTVTTVAVGSNPTGIAVNSNGTRAYVANSGSGTVSIINYGTSTLPLSLPITVAVGSNPTGVAVNSAGTIAYVTNLGGNTVSIIKYNGTGAPTVSTVTVSASPQSVKTSDNGNKAIVYSSGGYVTIIDANGSATQIPGLHPSFADYPGFTAMSGDGSTAYVTEHDNYRVTIIDTSNPGATPQYSSVNDLTHSIVSLPDGSAAFTVAHDAFWVIDRKTQQSTPVYVPVYNSGNQNERIAISSGGERVIAVSNYGDLTAFYLSGATSSASSQWWRTTPSTSSSTVKQDARGTVTGLLKKFTGDSDRIWIDKVQDGGTTRLVVYVSGVSPLPDFFSTGAFLQAKQGVIDPAVNKAINKVVDKLELDGSVSEIMLVGFSKGGSAVQNYAASGKYSGKVTSVVTFGSPLVKEATEYESEVNVLHLEAVNDYIPRDEGDETIFVPYTVSELKFFGISIPIQACCKIQASNRGVRGTFDNDKTDRKTIYMVDTENSPYGQYNKTLDQIKAGDGHSLDNYGVAAGEYEKNAYRWLQSRQVIDDIRRFNPGKATPILRAVPFNDINLPFWDVSV